MESKRLLNALPLAALAVVALALVAALGLAGCSSSSGVVARDSFSARATSDDGAIVAWSGYSEGYEPGAEATFEITLKNETDQEWPGRYCLQLMDQDSPQVLATLEQRPFTLEPGVGFSDEVTVTFPEALDPGAYGLSLAVRRPGGPMVDMVSVQIGEIDAVRRPTSQRDMDASLDACAPVEGSDQGAEDLVGLAEADLAQRLGIATSNIDVEGVEPAEFPDTSLGVPEPGRSYPFNLDAPLTPSS